MASTSRSSRRKAQAPGKLRISLKAKETKASASDDDSNLEDSEEETMVENGIPKDLPEGTIIVQPEAVDDSQAKAKKAAPVRIDTSVLDNVACTACGRQLNPYKNGAFQKHPELKVVICKRCEKFLSSGEISKDKDGSDEQCRWCGQGGRLSVCDECSKAFCKGCIMRNFNRSEFNTINAQKHWKCYLCDKAQLQSLRENYRNVRDTLKALQARDKAKAAAAGSTNGRASSRNSGSVPQGSTSAPARDAHSSASVFSGLSVEDLEFESKGLAAFMNRLSVATNTFRDTLRALRSQFESRTDDDVDSSPLKFNFSMGSNMLEQEKERRCAKALSMGIETYFKSMKAILVAQKLQAANVQAPENQATSSSSQQNSKVSTSRSLKESTSTLVSNRRQRETLESNESTKLLQNKKTFSKSTKSSSVNRKGSPDSDVISLSDGEEPLSDGENNRHASTVSSPEPSHKQGKSDSSEKQKQPPVVNCNEAENMAAKLALLNEDTSQSEAEASDGGENVATRSGVKNTPAKKDTVEEQQTDTCGPEDAADENTAAKKDLLQEEAASCGSDNGEDENMVAKLDLLNELAEKMIDDDSGGACEKEESRVSRKGSPSKKETPKKVEERSKRSNANMKEDNKSENSEMDIDNDRSGDKKEESRMSRRVASKKGKHTSEHCDKDSEDDKSKDSEMDIDDGDDSGDEMISKGARRTKRGDKKAAEDDKSKDSHKKNETEGKPGSKQLNIERPSRDNIVAEFSPLNSSDEEGKESEITGSKAKRNSSHTSDDDDDSRQAEKAKEKKSPTKRTREEKKGNKSKGGKIPESENDNVEKSSLGSLSSDDSDSDGNVKEKNVSKSETKKNKVTRKKTPVKSSTRKTEKTPAPQPVVSDVSSSDLLLSSDDEREAPAITTRKKRRGKCNDTPADANIEKENPSIKVTRSEDKKEQEKAKKSSVKPDSKEEKTDKPSKAKQPPSKATAKVDSNGKQDEPKAKLNGETKNTKTKSEDGEEDEMDKEIEKLSKLPTLRKRKAKEMKEDGDDGSVDNPEKSDEEEETKAPKKYKPGPKSSKAAKKNDYDNLSSDDEKPASDIDEEEDEEENDDLVPPVTFFLEPENKDDNEENRQNDEASMADEDSEKEEEKNENKDDDNSSSDEDIDVKKNTKSNRGKGGKKAKLDEAKKEEDADVDEEKEDDADEENENDEDGGKDETKKKKQIHSKLLDANISDSDDSDIVRKKKKKKASDEEASKGEESSSGSSLPSDSDEEDDNSEDTSNEDGEDSKKKKKKKGKKKGGRKKKGKGKKGTDEEEEEDSDEDSGKKKGKGKKRKRIKKVADSSDEDGEKDDDDDDDDDDEKNKSGKRKQIRKVMSNKKLEDSTKAAAKAEEKRRKRIAAKQREFNIETITDENNPMNCPITTKLVLEPGKEEGDPPIVQVNKKLIQKLKPHQVEAVQFMWDCMFESVKRSKKEEGAGCILAHCMGLGKTLSVISFVHTVLSHSKVLNQKTCLVVSPLNTVLNWQNEWGLWLDEEDQFDVWELASCKQNPARANLLKDWHSKGGIMIIGYEMYRNLSQGSRCKNKRQKKIFHETLVDPGPDMVVCDEGHILKNEASSISKAMNQMKTRRRVVLTGTPLQNNLNEYHCMVSFVKPNLLGTRREFNNRFISPIQNGQCTDSTQRDFKLMKARAHVLHEMLAGCVQRRDYSALTKFLPPKQEYVISVRLTDVQIDLYDKYLQMSGQGVDGVYNNKGARLFSDYQNLMKIWTHPWVLKLAEIRDELKMKYDDEDSFIDDESDGERSFSSSDSSSENEKMNLSDSGGEGTSLGPHSKKGTRRTRAKARRQAGEESDPEEVIAEWKSKTRNGDPKDDDEPVADGPKSVTKEWWAAYVTEEDQHKLELSNKLFLLFEILKMCEEIGDKVLIFSQSILSLNIIENFLETIDSKFQQECEQLKTEDTEDEKEEFGRSWTKGLDYYRMDGSTSAQNRQAWAANFNDIENHRTRLFLISTKAGGLGINLVSANRVIIFDASWNPSHDVQSIFRVYRFGQTKPCYIYRFLAQGTMEEKIYERQVTKLSLSQRVVDEHQIERHFSANDLKELYNFKPDRWSDGTEKPTLALPKDPLLAEILTNHKHCVLSFHEHDSLLENQIEQTLSEEEKKAAWEEYENEKKGIIIRGPGMERTASWPMMAAAQILSRQQITATVQALRQRLPDVSEELFHLHVQQELRRQVQLKQEEMRRMEMLRMQEIQIMNMIKYQAQQTGLSYEEVQTQMAPWIQMQMQQMHRMRAMQSHIMNAGTSGMHGSGSLPMMGGLGGASEAGAEGISNNPEEPIDLDDN